MLFEKTDYDKNLLCILQLSSIRKGMHYCFDLGVQYDIVAIGGVVDLHNHSPQASSH